MEYRNLGRCGMKVSLLGFGGWATFGEKVRDAGVQRKIIETAREAGINFFDLADVYAKGEAERAVGKILRQYPRHELVISSKVFFPFSDDINDRGLSRKHISESIDRSLKRIGTDYLDIYFCHRFDPETPLEETIRAMDDLIHRGKILYWGTSEWSADQIRDAWTLCEKHGYYPPQVEQPQYNLLFRRRVENEIFPLTEELGLGIVAFSPLASGLLTGKYDDGLPSGSRLEQLEWLRKIILTERNIELSRKFGVLAEQAGIERPLLALAWLLRRKQLSSILLGASSPEQLQQNLRALSVEISDDLAAELNLLFSS
ncbi:MAG: aldo/keto reductase [Candidatus Hydrogenedentota bacterium]|nr:MAG: aldo/keto reductase [Candidatus Hydrogenedentota bacterium]